ncbi:MAG: hypothetical protein A3K19_29210 [Lentisphaerae bacterium RIFOXYB12_FULL_65_16]|nr:MAG: hypothetical protein A3K18_13435 [Lentisphaerae bacterium RIFOXYA12_64_32]OGV88383.1 MAG: hypothetical protein A3K19_29210 [Lentisphaerae bacterium RIFOXYB12_FULL_65_16]
MNPRVKSVRPLPAYRLHLEFTNGEVGVFDCSRLLDVGVFQELKDVQYFNQVHVFLGSVAWPHEQDICPDTLYMDSTRTRADAA